MKRQTLQQSNRFYYSRHVRPDYEERYALGREYAPIDPDRPWVVSVKQCKVN